MIRKMGSFRSYVGLEEYELKPTSKMVEDNLQPDFLNGELVISEAVNVLKFTSLSKKKGLSGSLFVTNARVVFVSSDNVTSTDSTPLLSINTLWYYENPKGSTGGKKYRRVVKLGPSSANNPNLIPSGSPRVHEILIASSNFITTRYSFKFSPLDHGLRICNAIIHHAFPTQLERLFYFDFSKVTSADWRQTVCCSTVNIPSYLEKGDWLKELNLTRSTVGYRITSVNEGFQLCGSLPEWIVVPADLNDVRLRSLAEKLKGSRPPHWSWGDSHGAGILRMSKLNNEVDSSAENAFFEVLRKTHKKKRQPEILDLDKEIPSKEIKISFNKLIELCSPETQSHYEETDKSFYSNLDQTKWLFWVSKSLSLVNAMVDAIVKNQDVVILQEQESRDLSCLISSVIQVVIDSRFRTTTGFFSLIQKEWIAFGHPFHSLYMHASPVFLMFLDCVFQLMKQNPMEFEFNERLLIHIWDSCFDATRGTFLFDTPQQRRTMDRWNDYTAWSVILSKDKEQNSNQNQPVKLQFSGSSDSKLTTTVTNSLPLGNTLINPMYKLKSFIYPPTAENYPMSAVLECSSCMCNIHFWENLYLNRTLEASTPSIVSSGTNDPNNSKQLLQPSTRHDSNDSTPSSKSPECFESAFVYSWPIGGRSNQKIGRDPAVELKAVDILLAAQASQSSSTRYSRSSASASSSSSNNLFREKQVNRPSDSSKKVIRQSGQRRNPFSNL